MPRDCSLESNAARVALSIADVEYNPSNGSNHGSRSPILSHIKTGLPGAFELLALPLIVNLLCEVLGFAARVRGGLMMWETKPWHECKNN